MVILRPFVLAVSTLLVAGCGGGAGVNPVDASATPPATVAMLRARIAAAASVAPQQAADQLMDFAEAHFPQYFPEHVDDSSTGPFAYRYYAATQTYLGVVVADGSAYQTLGVYVMGGAFGNSPYYVGPLTAFITPTTAQRLVGTAAVGSAVPNASVAVTDGTGLSACVETGITTTAAGHYTCTLNPGEAAPFFVAVTDPTGNNPPLASIATATPPAGGTLVVNATPLTTAIVGQLAANGDAMGVVASHTVNASQLAAATANVIAQLQQVLVSIGAPAAYDPFTTAIVAASPTTSGNTADLVLAVVTVGIDPGTGNVALGTPSATGWVPLASATTTGTPVGAPDAALTGLAQATQLMAQTFAGCFSLPTSSRVLAQDNTIPATQGGPAVTGMAAACQNIASQASGGAGIAFLHNGYSAGQYFDAMLTSDAMTNATFSVPDVFAYYPASSSAAPGTPGFYDHAVLDMRYVDAQGNAGNFITTAARIPGSSAGTWPSEWWLIGNQETVDTSTKLEVRRMTQLNPANAGSTVPFVPSTFANSLHFIINPTGPGSILNGNKLHLARVTGPGLPTGGLTYIVSSNAAQTSMDLWNKTGSLFTGSECGNNGASQKCPNMWLEMTQGLTGTAATTLATNPVQMLWAQPADGFDISRFVKGTKYTIELFYGTNTGTADLTLKKTLWSDLLRATAISKLPWNSAGPGLLAAMDPNGSLTGLQTALPVDWVQNPSAQQIKNAAVMVKTDPPTFGPNEAVPKGATSVVVNNATTPAFGPTTTRGVLLNYRMLDGSAKAETWRWN
jgi:hypothetical protein